MEDDIVFNLNMFFDRLKCLRGISPISSVWVSANWKDET